MEKLVRFSGGTDSENGPTEVMRDRRSCTRLNSTYDQVIAVVRGAESILRFDPGRPRVS